MGTKFTYAVVLTLCGAALNLLLYFTGFQTEKLAVGQYFQWLGFILMFVVLFLGVKAVREEKPDQSLTYGQGVGAGTLIALYSSLMSAVYVYVHFRFINTAFADYQMEMVREKWAAVGMSEAQMEQAEGMVRMFMGPTFQAIVTPFAGTLVGLVMSLIIAAMLKRPPAGSPTPPPAGT